MISTDTGNFAEHIQRSGIRIQCEIQTVSQRYEIGDEWKILWGAAQNRMYGVQSVRQTIEIRGFPSITNIEIIRWD